MAWQTAKKYSQKRSNQPRITICPKTNILYFNTYIKNHIFNDRHKIIIRYDDEAKMMAFQPTYEGDNAYCVTTGRGNNNKGAWMYIRNILYQFDIEIKERMTFIPHWDSKIEWLIINLNGKEGDDDDK